MTSLLIAGWTFTANADTTNALPVRIESRQTINDLSAATGAEPGHVLTLRVVNIGHWNETTVIAALRTAAKILESCGIRMASAELLRLEVPEPYRHFDTPRSRELARALDLPKPVLYFAAETRQLPAFDAEAIGRGNSGSRPELRDTVWVVHGTRDLGLVIAHELAHVLMDSGAHDHTPGNLMAEETSPRNTQLKAAQCAQMRDTGTRNGLLRPGVN